MSDEKTVVGRRGFFAIGGAAALAASLRGAMGSGDEQPEPRTVILDESFSITPVTDVAGQCVINLAGYHFLAVECPANFCKDVLGEEIRTSGRRSKPFIDSAPEQQ